MQAKVNNHQQILRVFAKPNAKHTALLKIDEEGTLHIAVHAKPHKGAANLVLIAFLSELLQVPKSQITLRKGPTSKHKEFIIPWTKDMRKLIELISTQSTEKAKP